MSTAHAITPGITGAFQSSHTTKEDDMIGEPSYIELGVRDADAARSFYGPPCLAGPATGAGGPGR